MTINPTDSATGGIPSSSLGLLDDAVNISTTAQNATTTSTQSSTDSTSDASSVIDQVDMSATQAIQQMLDPSADSASTVAKFQQLIASGQYKPSGEAVAKSLLQEITTEIYFSGQSTDTTTATALSSSQTASTYLNPDGASTSSTQTATNGLTQDQDDLVQLISGDE